MKTNPTCRVCNVELDEENWYPSFRKLPSYVCKGCAKESQRLWRKANLKYDKEWRVANPEKAKARSTRCNRKQGHRPFNENKECASFLGVHIAERVLSEVFKDVEVMPYGNPGYDFICNKGKKIDVKSSCLRKDGCWGFSITHNTNADYFLCLAFDNREDLNPLHAWLLPGSKFNHFTGIGIAPSTIHKWDEYRLDLSKISDCCNTLR